MNEVLVFIVRSWIVIGLVILGGFYTLLPLGMRFCPEWMERHIVGREPTL